MKNLGKVLFILGIILFMIPFILGSEYFINIFSISSMICFAVALSIALAEKYICLHAIVTFTKSEIAANQVMKSICNWLERKLFLKVNATKTKVVRPTRSKYLGFTFLKNGGEWKVKPTTGKKKKLNQKLSEYLKRNKAVARPLAVTIKRVNEITRGWINYFRIGMLKKFMEELGEWLRHKIRVIAIQRLQQMKISLYM